VLGSPWPKRSQVRERERQDVSLGDVAGDGEVISDVDERLTPHADAGLTEVPPWARARVDVNANIHWINTWADFHVESGIALPLRNGDDHQQKMTFYMTVSSNLYGTLGLSRDTQTWLHVRWTDDSEGHVTWDAVRGDGHIYGPVAPHRYFGARATQSLFLKACMQGSGKGDVGENYGLSVRPHHLYLYY